MIYSTFQNANKMKNISYIILFFGFLSIQNQLNAQDDFPVIPLATDYTESNITNPELKEELIGTVRNVLNAFSYHGDFYNFDEGITSDDKVSEFSDLFSNETTIFNYLTVDNPQIISFDDFINYLYTYYDGQKYDFEILNAELTSLTVDANGNYYYGTITFEMKQYVGVDKKGQMKFFPKGVLNDLTLDLRIYPFDTSIGEITSLIGETRTDVSIDRVSNFDFSLSGGIGFLTAGIDDAYVDALGSLSTSATTLGFDGLYRKSINYNQTLYFVGGINVQLLSLTTQLENFYSFDNDNLMITNDASGAELRVNDSQVSGAGSPLGSSGSDNPNNTANGFVYEIVDGEEINQGFRIGIPIGVSYRLSKSFESRFFVDFMLVPSFIVWNNSTIDGRVNFVKVPENNFPDRNDVVDRIYTTDETGLINGAVNDVYTDSYDIGGSETKGLSPESTFDFDIMLSPSYKKLIGADWGISIGANVRMNLLNLFSKSDYEDDFLQNDLSNFANNRQNSIHQDLITGNRLFNTSIKIGYFKEF